MDFERLGEAYGYRRTLDHIEAQANAEIEKGNRAIHRLNCNVLALQAQRQALLDALREAAPGHPLLARTGRVYADGRRELAYEVPYVERFNREARGNGTVLIEEAMAPADRAEADYRAILAEPIADRGWFRQRWYWRGQEYATAGQARRAREEAAEAARDGALAA
ncbi:DUF4823 domain-containing protein [Methylobacterium iners]|uniref:Uncharacterized protein n=1 Tax=Methylobacterium iners TaxID=418707 RepID=A0ABQ4S4A9_9HYPH|nr:DUF4823 domain-containing protein [Methylobacterium iners]GJD97450.1 hypothetical protein OCOJLMKI_4681 [Methylobacterium iners]